MQKEKVMIVVSNLKIAGAQKMVEQLALAMDKNQYELNIICLSAPCNSIIEKRLIDNNISIIFLNKKPGFQYKMFSQIMFYVKKLKPSIIYINKHVVRKKIFSEFSYIGGCLIIFSFFAMYAYRMPISISSYVDFFVAGIICFVIVFFIYGILYVIYNRRIIFTIIKKRRKENIAR